MVRISGTLKKRNLEGHGVILKKGSGEGQQLEEN